MNDLLALSGTSQGRLIRDGAVSSVELVQAHLARIDHVNPSINAAIEVLRESALDAAKATDRRRAAGELLGPLDGVPFSVKDSMTIAGRPCTAGTVGFKHAPPSAVDATLVSRLRAAGAIPIARTNLPDLLFAFETDNLIFGRTDNPYDASKTCGGSSGGEAALIAACGSPFGLGSDAAGSVRLPAHFCGVASLKPTSGRLPRTGHVPPPGGWIECLWQIGPMARRVEDLWTLMPLLAGPDGQDSTCIGMPSRGPAEVNMRKLRIAYFTDNGITAATDDTVRVVQEAARALSSEGACVKEARPPGIEQSYDLEMQWIGPDGGDGLRNYLRAIGSDPVHPLLEGWMVKLEAYRTTLDGFAEYWASRDRFRAAMFVFLQNCDVILSPVCANPALPHGASIEDRNFRGFSYTMTYNVAGWPAAVVRCGQTSTGLPINVQVASGPWREDVALTVTRRLEELFGGWQPPPEG